MLCVCDQTKYIKHVHDEKCIKKFHFMCAFIIWCLFTYSSKYLKIGCYVCLACT